MRLSVCLLAVSACGRLQFDLTDDGRTDDGSRTADAAPPLGPFSTPQRIASLSQPGHDDDPTATGNALELYYQTDLLGAAGAYADIYVATRATVNDAWGTSAPVAALNSSDEDQAPGITVDGLTIYFSSRRPGGTGGSMNSDIWVSTRTSLTAPWSVPVVDPNLSSTSDEFEPQPDATHTRLVLYRSLGTTDKDLFEATRPNTGSPWGTPVALTELNTTGAERSPFLTPDGLTIYFSSDRASSTAGVNDMYVATRPSLTAPFGTPTPVAELNTPNDDDDPWLSVDGHILLMTSDRSGDYEVYEARR